MNPSAQPSSGIAESLRSVSDGFLGAVKERVELFALEMEEEKYRLIQTFVWISAAMFVGALAVMFGTFAVVFLFWESARIAVLSCLAVLYTALFVATVMWVRRKLALQPRPFAATLEEIEEDRQCIRGRK